MLQDSNDLNVAVIGDFQIGKSTFVNCLIGRSDAEMGMGVTTTHRSASYRICKGVSVIDTPGFNAPGSDGEKDAEEARKAIDRSFAVVVYLDKPMGDVCRTLVKEALSQGKRCVFVYNCTNRDRWSPEESEDVRRCIEAEVFNLGYSDSIVRLGKPLVHSINAQWALFGLGLLDNEKSLKKIRYYAYEELGIPEGADLKTELLCRSNLLVIRRYVQNLPVEVLSDFLKNRDREMKRLTDRFCEEFARRLGAKGAA